MMAMKLKADTWKQKCDAVSALRALASLAIMGGVCMLFLCFVTKGGQHDISPTWPLTGLLPILIAAAALLGRKITAILFALMSASIAVMIFIICASMQPSPFMIIPLIIALLCFLPAIFTLRAWEALK